MSVSSDKPEYDPVKKCIYCGAEGYAAGSKRDLASEHIIPFGLKGEWVLPEASCQKCERITGRNDSLLLKGALLGCRILLNLPTRKPKERPKALPLFVGNGPTTRKVMVPIADYPISLLLLQLAPPTMVDSSSQGGALGAWQHFFQCDTNLLAQNYGLHTWATSSLDSYALCQVLAKIGHSYAVAELGLDGFKPFLKDFIKPISKEFIQEIEERQFAYVGPSDQPAEETLHSVSFEQPDNTPYIVVRIRLFAYLGTPVYRVVVGER